MTTVFDKDLEDQLKDRPPGSALVIDPQPDHALAAYAAAAGLECHVFMPRDTPRAFQVEVRACGAHLELVDGLISDCGRRVAERREAGKYRGVRPTLLIEPGVSGSDWTDRQRSDRSALPTRSRDDVAELPEYLLGAVTADGRIEAKLATDTSGQGHQTIVSQLLADELGVRPDDVEVGYRGSAEAPTEYGTAASRMAVMLSGAAVRLGEALRENLETLAAREWDVEVEDVAYRDGGVDRLDASDRLSLAELADLDASGDGRPTRVEAVYEHPATAIEAFDEAFRQKLPVYPTAAFAVDAPIVEVDARTGEVELLTFYTLRDCGTVLNPMIVDGQTAGGIAQGIGAALMEEFAYSEAGQPLSTTLFDYRLPSIENVPEIEIEHTETPSPFTETGAKGTGEGGMIDAPAAIASSINAALASTGVVADQLPFTPNRVRRRLREREGDGRGAESGTPDGDDGRDRP